MRGVCWQNAVMRLFAAIMPPRAVLEDLTRVVRSVHAADPGAEPARGLLRRLSGRVTHVAGRAATELPVSEELDVPDMAQMYLPITRFGNVTLGDSVKLANALRAEVATWARPEVTFAGGTALEFPGDESVWAKLEGDIGALNTIGRGVPATVQRLGYFVDRRQFRPWLSVGTITDKTTAPYLQSVVDALEAFRGTPWTIEGVSLMRRPPQSESPDTFEEMELMPLAT